MSKHTPGPWIMNSPNGIGVGANTVCFDHGAGLCQVAIVDAIRTEDRILVSNEQAEANARLVTAAPEMLSTLKALLSVYEDTDCPEGNYGYQSIKAVIAKAEGSGS